MLELTGIGKSKMEYAILELSVSWLVHKIASKLKDYAYVSGFSYPIRLLVITNRTKLEKPTVDSPIYGGLQTTTTHNAASGQNSNEISSGRQMFYDQDFQWCFFRYVGISLLHV